MRKRGRCISIFVLLPVQRPKPFDKCGVNCIGERSMTTWTRRGGRLSNNGSVTAKSILEGSGMQTSSSFVKI